MNTEKDKSSVKKIWELVSKAFEGALIKVLTSLITTLILFLVALVASIPLTMLVSIPLWVILLVTPIVVFSLVYIAHGFIKTRRAKNQPTQEPELQEVKLSFEKFPREWRGKFAWNGKEWKPRSELEVYCTKHYLRLIIQTDEYLTMIGQHRDQATVTECPDCRNENVVYQETEWPHWPSGFAIHTPAYWLDLKQEILNRMERELQKKEIKQ